MPETTSIHQHLDEVVSVFANVKEFVEGTWPFDTVKEMSRAIGPVGSRFVCELLNLINLDISELEVSDEEVYRFFKKNKYLSSAFGKKNIHELREAYGKLKIYTSASKLKKEFPFLRISLLEELAQNNKSAIDNCSSAIRHYLFGVLQPIDKVSFIDFESLQSSFCEFLFHIANGDYDDKSIEEIYLKGK